MIQSKQQGFTLIEIIVSTAIFVMVVSSTLGVFNYTLKINRRVQSLRELVQGTRAFTETITREVRNGRIDYDTWTNECTADYYRTPKQSLGIITLSGDKLCFYLNNGVLFVKRQTPTAVTNEPLFNSTRFHIIQSTFRFDVHPVTTPSPRVGGNPGIQPFVTIVAQLSLDSGAGQDSALINYQTTISTDVYDIPPYSTGTGIVVGGGEDDVAGQGFGGVELQQE